MNNHLFDDKTIRAIYSACVESGIDYMEIGYKNSGRIFSASNFGARRFCKEDDIRSIVGDNETKLKLSAIADAEKSDYPGGYPSKTSKCIGYDKNCYL